MKSQITIRMNGETNSVTVDGRVFDRSRLTKEENKKLRRMIVEAKGMEYRTNA
jgi:hypothetical protein